MFRISSRSFYQINPVQTEVLYNKAMDFAGLKGDETVLEKLSHAHYIITIEDGIAEDGFGTQIASYMSSHGFGAQVIPVGVPNRVIEQGTIAEQDDECGLSAEKLAATIKSCMGGIYA